MRCRVLAVLLLSLAGRTPFAWEGAAGANIPPTAYARLRARKDALWCSRSSSPMKIEPVTLSGSIVRLEPYRAEHFEEVCAAVLSAPEIFRYIPVRMQTREDVVARFAVAEGMMETGNAVFFLTRLADTGELVGSTSSIVTDALHRRLEIGFTWILPRAQRTAVNTEAKLLQMTHAFETLGCIRVEFKTDARNEASRAALLRIGAKEEGTLRSHMICWDGHLRDSVYFSVIAAEWPATRARLQGMLGHPPT